MTVPSVVAIRSHLDARGSLGVVEGADLPFEIRRIYYLFDVPIGAVRGEHGHKQLEQLIICMNGRCDITLNDGRGQFHFTLDRPTQGLHVPPGMWRQLRFREPGTVVCVLASRPYEVEDYIYSFEEFLTWAKARRAGGKE
jgi:dTDP-4-dehydrorhamnose 3,5-epimerase-like enzyme